MSNERPWLDHYPQGVPAEIDLNAYASVVAVLEESFQRFRDHAAFANFGKAPSSAAATLPGVRKKTVEPERAQNGSVPPLTEACKRVPPESGWT